MRIILLFLCMLGCAFAGELPCGIRVVSYNIHHGVGMDGKLNLRRIAKIIRKQNPDLVALQEVDHQVRRSGGTDQVGALAKMLGMHHAFGKCIDLQGGGYGNAVLSKYPILKTRVHRLPGKGEARVVLEIIVKKDGGKLSFCSVHLDWKNEASRLLQAKAVVRVLGVHKHPMILAGDFNARPESETMNFLSQAWTIIPKTGSALTCPADKPVKEIDYVLTNGFNVTRATCRVLAEKIASDHRPLTGIVYPRQ